MMKTTGHNAIWKVGGGLLGLVVLLIILIAANVILGGLRLRTDLTEKKLYTLSKGSLKILSSLEQDVVLKLYCNSEAPDVPVYLKNYARQVKDLLHEYGVRAKGRITVETYNPEPDSEAEEWAQRYGITGQPMGVFGSPFYFGLVAVAGETEAVLPVLDPRTEGLLEYNLTRHIYRVVHPEKPVLGVISPLSVLGVAAPPYGMPGQPRPESKPAWLAFQDLREDYDLRDVTLPTEAIDADIETLIVVHPKELDDRTLYAIDQFVLRGGRLLAFVDPLCVADLESSQAPNQFGMNKASSDLGPLLPAWGIDFQADQVIGDWSAMSPIRTGANQVEDSPVWLSLKTANLNHDDIVTAQLDTLMLPFAGAFSDNTTEELTVTPLITSSKNAGMVNAMTAQFGGPSLRSALKSTGVPKSLAIRVSGTFKTAFPGGKPASADEENAPDAEETTPAASLQSGESTVILVADVDMLYDRFCVQELNFFGTKAYQPMNDNVSLFGNTVEQIAGSADLVGIRSRGEFSRPFDRVQALQEKAMKAWQEKEERLEKKLQETQAQLRELQVGKQQNQRFILSPEQQQAIENFRSAEVQIKHDLKDVRKSLRKDIEVLGVWVKVINIGLMPLLVGLAGAGYGIFRHVRN